MNMAAKKYLHSGDNTAFSGDSGDDGLYPEVEMAIEQEAYRAFLSAAEYGSEGVAHLLRTIEQLKERMDGYGSY